MAERSAPKARGVLMRVAVTRALAIAVVFTVCCVAGLAHAFPAYVAQLPCTATAVNSAGQTRPCITCHNNPDGGNGCPAPPCWNPFGAAFDANSKRWTMALALMDSDGDGYTNGEELVDPSGTWTTALPSPNNCGCATRPGFASYTPGDTDADQDGYCCRGQDMNGDRDCRDTGEHTLVSDCNEQNAAISPGDPEICTNTIDDDCDGLPSLQDPDCADVLDRDDDGYCPRGRDTNGNGNCLDAGEMTSDVDCNDDEVTVHPGAPENCSDGLDNNCNGRIDAADSLCSGDRDADNDGYCPVGTDVNNDGDCLDAGEDASGVDCNDADRFINPDATEACSDGVDNDCDGNADFADAACSAYFDDDSDGYCEAGIDGNGDRDCVDDGEGGGVTDCNDADPAVNPARSEDCVNGIDDDCNGQTDLMDSGCATYVDSDGDHYCFVGYDLTGDGDCADTDEANGQSDCDDSNDTVNPDATEDCTDGLDNDCDGSLDAFDQPTCDDYRDRDGDGWCVVGVDSNADGDCSDPSEQQEPNDAGHDSEPTVYPGAPENCLDGIDNDLDGEIDEASACTSDSDADGDGYCPLGHDLNGDGDCLDEAENEAVGDCNDGDPAIHPQATEDCYGNVDLDCDANVSLSDSDCAFIRDQDGDGFCGMGIDDNHNGSCLDEGENRFGVDCDDANPTISPRAAEVCDNGIDDDCDGLIDTPDPSCPCTTDASCDDGDPCTHDACGAAGDCSHTPDSTCGDGGIGTPTGDCDCRVNGRRDGTLFFWLVPLALLLLRRRRRSAGN